MLKSLFFLSCLLVLPLVLTEETEEPQTEAQNISGSWSRGYNDAIPWKSLKDGFEEAVKEDKPVMILISKSDCPACDLLKEVFKKSKKILELSEDFVMITMVDREIPPNEINSKYHPDGLDYVPRILFADPDGDIRIDIFNGIGNPEFKYYYFREDQVVNSMTAVLEDTPVPTHPPAPESNGEEGSCQAPSTADSTTADEQGNKEVKDEL